MPQLDFLLYVRSSFFLILFCYILVCFLSFFFLLFSFIFLQLFFIFYFLLYKNFNVIELIDSFFFLSFRVSILFKSFKSSFFYFELCFIDGRDSFSFFSLSSCLSGCFKYVFYQKSPSSFYCLKKKSDPYHIITRSFIPFFISIFICFFLFYFASYISGIVYLLLSCVVGFFVVVLLLIGTWAISLSNEYSTPLIYTKTVQLNIVSGMFLFILSEIMLFFSFFWAFFHFSLAPSIFIGNVWPPLNIIALDPFSLPLLNTILLLSSGVTVNSFYYNLKSFVFFKVTKLQYFSLLNNRLYYKPEVCDDILFYIELYKRFSLYNNFLYDSLLTIVSAYRLFYLFNIVGLFFLYINLLLYFFSLTKSFFFNLLLNFKVFLNKSLCFMVYFYLSVIYMSSISFRLSSIFMKLIIIDYNLFYTIFFGLLFLCFQFVEYFYHATFSLNNVYGSTFYMLTGLHGSHVFVGVILLTITYLRLFFFNNYSLLSRDYYLLMTCSVYYWHFVDVVWLYLYVFVYLLNI